jgi:hypothetical protein
LRRLCRVRYTKKAEEDAAFYLIKDGSFFPLLCLTNPALVYQQEVTILDVLLSAVCFFVYCPHFNGMRSATDILYSKTGNSF